MAATKRNKAKYSNALKKKALKLYEAEGLAAAVKQLADQGSPVPKSTLRLWATKAGISSGKPVTHTAEATRARQIDMQAKRETLKVMLLDRSIFLLDLMDKPDIDYVGRDGYRVKRPRPTPSGQRDLATAVGILIDKLRLENNEAAPTSSSRHEFSISDFDQFMKQQMGEAYNS